MLRLRALRMTGFVVCALSGPVASPAAPADPAPLLDEGPLGAQLRSAAPEIVPNLENQLKRLIESGRGPDTSKGNQTPTPAERTQLAANPAFAKAYESRPTEALRLLRWADDVLSKSKGQKN